jgi:hypothetical protein
MDPSGIDDWADQDLLTKDEARDRLVDEIARTRTRLATMKQPDDHAEIMLLEGRLAAMESIRGEYDAYIEDHASADRE